MVKSIEEYISETTKSYDPAIKAYNTQLSGLAGQTENAIKDIENQYANQRAQLLTSANQAAEAASLSAAGNGGSFGGATNEANRKYYERSFVPAMTSSNTNRASAISQAQANEANRRSSLEQQLANLYTQANTYGTQRYDQAVAAEAAQRQFEAEMAEKQRQYNENLAFQKAQQEEAIRQYNENLALQREQLAESARQHSASLAAQNKANSINERALGYLNEPTVETNLPTRTVMIGALPVEQVYKDGAWVNKDGSSYDDVIKQSTKLKIQNAVSNLFGRK